MKVFAEATNDDHQKRYEGLESVEAGVAGDVLKIVKRG